MTECYGWTGQLLHVDLDAGQTSNLDTRDFLADYIGGVGLAARLAWEMLSPNLDPLAPQNPLFLMTGPLTGTLASGAGRVEVLGVAPQQRPAVFSRSGMGGHWGAELKYAGYDGIVVVGQAARPVYLWIDDGKAELLPAGELWGMGTYGTTRALRALYGPATRVLSCGQAGERRSRIAVVQTETGNAAGQGGYGGVMGAKRLKAIAVRGTGSVRVAHPHALLDLCLHASREGQNPDPFLGFWRARRHTTGRLRKCGFCMSPCVHVLLENAHAADGTRAATVARQCWAYDGTSRGDDSVARAMTSDYGLNGWEITYGMIPWLQLCKQHGLVDALQFGSGRAVDIPVPDKRIEYLRDCAPPSSEFLHALIHGIAFREGAMGDALAEGTCHAAEQLFEGAGLPLLDPIYPRRCGQTEHWGGHWGPGGTVYWPWWLPSILQWCIDTRDPASDSTHQWTEHVQTYMPVSGPHRGPFTEETVRAVCAEVYGHPDVCDHRYTYDPPELKALPARWHSYRGMVVDSLILCDYEHTRVFSTIGESGKADTALTAKLLSACTGIETSEAELHRAGERIWNMLRAIDVRYFDRDRAIDESTLVGFDFPGKDDGVMLDRGRFLKLLDVYYEQSGWDAQRGWPTRARLASLGMEDVADGLEAAGRLGG